MTHLGAFLLGLVVRDLFERWRRWEHGESSKAFRAYRGVNLWPPPLDPYLEQYIRRSGSLPG